MPLEGGIALVASWSLNRSVSQGRYVKVQYRLFTRHYAKTTRHNGYSECWPIDSYKGKDVVVAWLGNYEYFSKAGGALAVFLKTIQRAEIQYEYDLWKRLSIEFNLVLLIRKFNYIQWVVKWVLADAPNHSLAAINYILDHDWWQLGSDRDSLQGNVKGKDHRSLQSDIKFHCFPYWTWFNWRKEKEFVTTEFIIPSDRMPFVWPCKVISRCIWCEGETQ